MTTQHLSRFNMQRPFEPFTMVTADGRELHVPHPDYVGVGEQVLSAVYVHPSGQIEIVDTALIVSIRTIYSADLAGYTE